MSQTIKPKPSRITVNRLLMLTKINDFFGSSHFAIDGIPVPMFEHVVLSNAQSVLRKYGFLVKVSSNEDKRGTLVGLSGLYRALGYDWRLLSHVMDKLIACKEDVYRYKSKRSDRLRISFYYK